MAYEEVVREVMIDGLDILIPCENKSRQESIRAMVFHAKKKVALDESIGISKYDFADRLFVKVYKRKGSELYHLNKDGIPVLIKRKLIDLPENARQVALMRKDGVSEEDIERIIQGGE